jgi:hypothetical protein
MENKEEQKKVKLINCKYCCSPIHTEAKVCQYCGKYQKKLFNNIFSINATTTIISLLLLVLSFFQYRDANIEKGKSIEAANNANLALHKVTETENRILLIKNDIIKTSQAFIEIAEILPRSTGYGAGLSKEDHQKLNTYSDSLNVLISRLKNNK